MCMLALAYRVHPEMPLVLCANRDEFYDRPTQPAEFWAEEPGLLAGRDLKAGGTWLGITREGRFAALTNFRAPQEHRDRRPTRGLLPLEFLRGDDAPRDYLTRLRRSSDHYNGFNLIVGELSGGIYYFSNRTNEVVPVHPGVHGLSNDLMNSPWPKVTASVGRLEQAIAEARLDDEALFGLLADSDPAADHLLPETGVGLEWERALSPPFIRTAAYGTRSSTIITVDNSGVVRFVERTFEAGSPTATREYSFEIEESVITQP
jgi:uncharacterized protein with NRDE domain